MHYLIPMVFILITSCNAYNPLTTEKTSITDIKEDEKKFLITLTRNFYTNYLSYLEGNDTLSLSEYLDLQEEVGHVFQQKISDMIQQAKLNPPYDGSLGGDPIIMGQDYPPSFQYSEPIITQDKAMIYVFRDWGTRPIDRSDYIIVKLRKIEKSWEIIDILLSRH